LQIGALQKFASITSGGGGGDGTVIGESADLADLATHGPDTKLELRFGILLDSRMHEFLEGYEFPQFVERIFSAYRACGYARIE
jgi:hypothetical protein